MSQQIEKYKQSKILQRLLEVLAPDFNKLRDKVNAVFEQGRREGLDDMEIGDLVRMQMKEHYTDRAIRNILPNTAKHNKFTNKAEKTSASKEPKMSSYEREPIDIPSDKVSITSTELEEHNFNTEGMGVAIPDEDDTDIPPKEESIQLPEDIHNHIADLERENKFLKEALAQFRHDNSILLEQVKKHEQLPNNDALFNQIALLKKELEQERGISLEASNIIEKLHQTIATLEGQLNNAPVKKEGTNQDKG